jgi:hypothetical protein
MLAIVSARGRGRGGGFALLRPLAPRFHRFEDGALPVVASARSRCSPRALALIVPFVTPLFPALLVAIFTWWRNPPRPPLPWIRLGRFGWSGALAAALVAAVAGAVAAGAREAAAHLTAAPGSLLGNLAVIPPPWSGAPSH